MSITQPSFLNQLPRRRPIYEILSQAAILWRKLIRATAVQIMLGNRT